MSLKTTLISTSRFNKKLIVLFTDLFFLCLTTQFSLIISNISLGSIHTEHFLRLLWLPLFSVISFWFLGVYNSVVRFIDFSVIIIIARAIGIVFVINLLVAYSYGTFLQFFQFSNSEPLITSIGWLVGLVTFSFLAIISRLVASLYLSKKDPDKRVVIYGAGSAGIQLANALRVSKEVQPIAFLDDNPSLHGTYLGGIKVLNPTRLERLSQRKKVDEVLIAIPSASRSTLLSLLRDIENFSLKVRILPGLVDLAQGKISVSELKEVDISDLLGRYEVEANLSLINKNIENKVVMVTGAGGSIGSEIARQVAKNTAKKIILLDSNEYALYSIKNEILGYENLPDIYAVLANVNNKKRIKEVCAAFSVDTIYHTAAYKHVPLVEENPFEAVVNNINGTKVCVEAAVESNVESFVLISTDKAVRPTNIMGATKRFAELILQAISQSATNTRMMMVRFGNVIGSSGSAIPLFQEQIKNGGPVTVTDPEVIRYFMTIPEAAELVIQAGAMGKGGDVFVLDMGEPVKIYELAKRLINLSGMEVKDDEKPDGDIEIIFTGLRPGEKLYEELLIGDNVSSTEHPQIMRAEEDSLSLGELEQYLRELDEAEKTGNVSALRDILKQAVSGFTPEKEIADIVYKQQK
tara:strand:- start:193 stop:2100 length:1908 start_codon:yes stop_codon:yes gene_type:complete